MSDAQPFVLVIDSDPATPGVLKGTALLIAPTYEARVARDQESALSAMREKPPDLLVLSTELPGMESWQSFARLVRERKISAPILLVSRNAVVNAEEARALGVRDHLQKPLLAPVFRFTLTRA